MGTSLTSASAVIDDGDQCTGFFPRYTWPFKNICPNTSI